MQRSGGGGKGANERAWVVVVEWKCTYSPTIPWSLSFLIFFYFHCHYHYLCHSTSSSLHFHFHLQDSSGHCYRVCCSGPTKSDFLRIPGNWQQIPWFYARMGYFTNECCNLAISCVIQRCSVQHSGWGIPSWRERAVLLLLWKVPLWAGIVLVFNISHWGK